MFQVSKNIVFVKMHKMHISHKQETAILHFLSSEEEASAETPLWRRFASATDTSLGMMKELFE